MLHISSDPLDIEPELTKLNNTNGDVGGVVSFLGCVRKSSARGDVLSLRLQSYSPLTENGILSALSTAKRRWSLQGAMILHRVGNMKPGDAIVFVATAAEHRRAAFEATDYLMDYLKTEAVFWKEETTRTGSTWIEPRHEDYCDAQRWRAKETDLCMA